MLRSWGKRHSKCYFLSIIFIANFLDKHFMHTFSDDAMQIEVKIMITLLPLVIWQVSRSLVISRCCIDGSFGKHNVVWVFDTKSLSSVASWKCRIQLIRNNSKSHLVCVSVAQLLMYRCLLRVLTSCHVLPCWNKTILWYQSCFLGNKRTTLCVKTQSIKIYKSITEQVL